MLSAVFTYADDIGDYFSVLNEDGKRIGSLEPSFHSDTAKYLAYKGDRYVGQAETREYCLNHFFG